jgi:membrane-bound lytic murein transglycosylase D
MSRLELAPFDANRSQVMSLPSFALPLILALGAASVPRTAPATETETPAGLGQAGPVAAPRAIDPKRAERFPRPAVLEPQIQFWIKVYSQYTTSQMALHDAEELDIIYTVVDLPPGEDPAIVQVRRQILRETRERYEDALKCLASAKSPVELDPLALEVREIWGERGSPEEFDLAVTRLRFQLGQADRFQAGIVRSGRYLPRMRRIATEVEAPAELLVLPHVESSFDPLALSHRNASGIWQWTRGTGRHYMRIDRQVDERRDPFLATRASLRCLSQYYAELGAWPLAITAYNHGIEGMRRARDELLTTDIARIIQEYRGPAFRFASRNFYPEFLAALEVSENYQAYFGALDQEAPDEMDMVPLKRALPWQRAAKHAGISSSELARMNPAVLSPVVKGKRPIPAGYELRVPAGRGALVLADLDPAARRAGAETLLLDSGKYQVRRGDTLTHIARRFGVQVDTLLALNNLESHRIFPGQVLLVPSEDAGSTP